MQGSYLEFHHHIVEAIIPTTAHKATHVVLACERKIYTVSALPIFMFKPLFGVEKLPSGFTNKVQSQCYFCSRKFGGQRTEMGSNALL